MASPAPGSADLVHGRRLEKSVAWSGVQRTAPAVPPAVDVAIRPPETGFGTAAGAGAKMTRRRALSALAGAGVAAGTGVTACDKSQPQQVSPGLKSPRLKATSLTGTSLTGTSLKAPGIWRFQTPGPVVEGLVAVGSVVYTADDNLNGGSDSHNVYALDARTGAAVWAAANYAESYTGPVVGNDLVYVGSDFHTVTALHARTGHMAWQYVTGDVVTGAPAVYAARDLTRQMRTLPSIDPMDPGYRRLRYLRYADDHILGSSGRRPKPSRSRPNWRRSSGRPSGWNSARTRP